MGTQYDGGILGGFLQGMRLSDEDVRTKRAFEENQKEREIQRQRQAKADSRTDTEFNWRSQDRPGEVQFRDEQRDQTRKHWTNQATVFDQSQEDRTYGINRRPVLEQREQQMFDAQIGNQRASAAAQSQMARLRDLQIDEAELATRARQGQRALYAGFAAGTRGGDWSTLRDGFNETVGRDMGIQIANIQRGENGAIVVSTADGKTMPFESDDKLFETLTAFTNPEGYANGMLAHLGRGQNEPAAITEARTVAGWLPPQEGESKEGRLMRAYEMSNLRAGQSPQQIATTVFTAAMKQPGATEADAMQAVSAYMRNFHPDARGPWSNVSAPQPPPEEKPGVLSRMFGGGGASAPAPRASSQVPPQAVEYLRANPQMRAAFDAKYGPGAAAAALAQ